MDSRNRAGRTPFFRNHPLVADYVEAWKRDPKTPQVIREELSTLITNDAFRMK